jgi:hypothetical protein
MQASFDLLHFPTRLFTAASSSSSQENSPDSVYSFASMSDILPMEDNDADTTKLVSRFLPPPSPIPHPSTDRRRVWNDFSTLSDYEQEEDDQVVPQNLQLPSTHLMVETQAFVNGVNVSSLLGNGRAKTPSKQQDNDADVGTEISLVAVGANQVAENAVPLEAQEMHVTEGHHVVEYLDRSDSVSPSAKRNYEQVEVKSANWKPVQVCLNH